VGRKFGSDQERVATRTASSLRGLPRDGSDNGKKRIVRLDAETVIPEDIKPFIASSKSLDKLEDQPEGFDSHNNRHALYLRFVAE
jgi:hypothetical protein